MKKILFDNKKFMEWINENYIEFFTGRFELKDEPNKGNWLIEELREKYNNYLNTK